jgi:TPR repeat protein
MREVQLFTQPDSTHLGECPICFLPLSFEEGKNSLFSCCMELVCNGCNYAHDVQHGIDACPFCREPSVDSNEENEKRAMDRVKANDPAALCQMGTRIYHDGDVDKAIEYWTKSAELGEAQAHYDLGLIVYRKGGGVREDERKAIYHYENTAIAGHPEARTNLGVYEWENGRVERAVKHFIIAANLGEENSMKNVLNLFKAGHITKDDFDATIRTHQAAINATKSAERDFAEVALKGLVDEQHH